MSGIEVSLHSLHIYPIKSCAGIALDEGLLVETGLDLDRAWMLVDAHNEFVSQRQLPRMALVQPSLKHDAVVLRAPGMLALHLSLDGVEGPVRVKVWNDSVAAFDMGALAAQWFSDFLGRKLRLVRFDPAQRRLSDRHWTGAFEAENAFSDGFPLLVVSTASLAELNQRLRARGEPEVGMARMRPNLVLDGLSAHDEDALDEIVFTTAANPVRLRLVKPCARCTIPDIDPLTAQAGHAVGDVLAGYRADARLQGAVTFGMNAVIVEGLESTLRPGMLGIANYRFD